MTRDDLEKHTYFYVGVPFAHLANFTTFCAALPEPFESQFFHVGRSEESGPTIGWLMRFSNDGALTFLSVVLQVYFGKIGIEVDQIDASYKAKEPLIYDFFEEAKPDNWKRGLHFAAA